MLSRTTIPRNHLTIYATANNDLGILRGELDSWDFDWGLESKLGEDNLTISEVKDQHLWLEWLATDLSSILEGEVLNDTHRHDGRLSGVEFDTCNCSEFRIWSLVKELPRDRIYRTIIIGAGGYLIAQSLEIILEDIDDFIGLQLTLDTRGNSVDESIQALSKLLIVLKSLSGLTNEILRIVVRDS